MLNHHCQMSKDLRVGEGASRKAAGGPLATWAKVRGSTTECDPLDRGPASPAGAAGSAIDIVQALEIARQTGGIHVIPKRAASVEDSAFQHLLDLQGQPADLGRGERVGRGGRMNAGREERFVDVDVSQPREESLVEQGRLDGPPRPAEPAGKLVCPDRQRLGAERIVVGLPEPADATESPRVPQPQLPYILELNNQVGMRQQRRVIRLNREPAAHAEVNEPAVAVVQREHDPFSAAIDAPHAAANEVSPQGKPLRRDEVGAAVRHRNDHLPRQPR